MRERPFATSLRWVLVLVPMVSCSRRQVDEELPRKLPTQELFDASAKAAVCDSGSCNGRCVDLDGDPKSCGVCGKVCDQGQGCVAGLCTVSVDWTSTAVTMITAADKGLCKVGSRRAVRCPAATPTPSPWIWGTDLYTSDSSICLAAVHAGLIDPAKGGDVGIELVGGAPWYAGTVRHGVTTAAYGAFWCSFRLIITAACTAPLTACGTHCSDLLTAHDDCGSCGTSCDPTWACRRGTCREELEATWSTTASERANTGSAPTSYTYECPAAGTLGNVWGTDIYTADSSICSSAVHAGKITSSAGGIVRLVMRAGLPSYKGSTRNGVTSASYGAWSSSYEFR